MSIGNEQERAKVVPLERRKAVQPCPVCAKPSEHTYRPFCSSRCADVDLGRWLKGTYRIPSNEAPEPSDQPADED